MRAKHKNKEAREKDGFDPGAVTTGLQGDAIQPLGLPRQSRRLREDDTSQSDGERGWQLVHPGSSMIVSATGKPATTTNPESIVAPGKAQEFEWYIHPQMQEGVRQFHSYSHDRELTVLGLFGAFIVEPKGSKYRRFSWKGPVPAQGGHERLAGEYRQRVRTGLPRIRAVLS